MPTLNDYMYTALTDAGYTSSNINDKLYAFYKAETGLTGSFSDVEYQYWATQAGTTGFLPDLKFIALRNSGYTGSLTDMWYQFWAAGLTPVEPVLESSVLFNGTNSNVNINFPSGGAASNSSYTLVMRVKNVSSDTGLIFQYGEQSSTSDIVELEARASSDVRARASDGSSGSDRVQSSSALANSWQTHVIRLDGASSPNCKYYIDGVDVTASKTVSYAPAWPWTTVNAGRFTFGRNPYSATNHLNFELAYAWLTDENIDISDTTNYNRLVDSVSGLPIIFDGDGADGSPTSTSPKLYLYNDDIINGTNRGAWGNFDTVSNITAGSDPT